MSHDRQDMSEQPAPLDSAFSKCLEKYVVNVTPHLRIFLDEVQDLPEIKNLNLAMRTILFGVIGRFHHEMERGLSKMDLDPLEAYAYGLHKVMVDPNVTSFMNEMMKTGVNAAVNNMLEM